MANDDKPAAASIIPPLPQDPGAVVLQLFVAELVRRLREDGKAMTAAELNVVRQCLSDWSVGLQRAKAGEFGDLVKSVADDFPFDENDNPILETRQ